ncbi:MAG: ABC transporter ATP-binding protein, partial [Deltaproteobacteria bacterium]|nr:ABC transporter ATP-binding protein [Deltaproteobacteria bacterium]
MQHPVVEAVGVGKRYGVRFALRDVTLALPAGGCLGLLGANGAGKTTLLRLLLGFCRPTRGAVRLRGADPRRPGARRGVGWLPEQLLLPGHARVRGFLRLCARLAGCSAAQARREADWAIEWSGLGGRGNERLARLSKGLRQRVGFAQALLGKPQILLLDEPTSGLDPAGLRDARQWIADARARGAAVLVSSHILSEVERSCEQIAVLRAGRLVGAGDLPGLLRDGETLEDAYLRLANPERPAQAASAGEAAGAAGAAPPAGEAATAESAGEAGPPQTAGPA